MAKTAENNLDLAALTCVPPYLSVVVSSFNWFGTYGLPAPNLDVSELIGAEMPEEYAPLFEQGMSLAAEIASLYPSGDTIPFSVYSCPALGIPPIVVTPVIIEGVPIGPWFS